MADPNMDVASKPSEPRKDEKLIKLRPTLFVAIGGTGMEVLMRLRRRTLNALWGSGVRVESLTDFPVAQFIQFDLDQGALVESGRATQEDLQYDLLKFSDDEKLVETFDIEKYSRDDDALARFPHIQNWLPLHPGKIRDLKIDPAKGAGQIRSISRLYFFDKYAKVRDKIRLKLKALKSGLSRDAQLKQLGLELDQSKYRIVIVGSVAGGTGSGSFLDMGWLSSWIARDEVGSADVELMLFLPTGFASANKDRTEGNGYAALMELETAMRGYSDYVKRWDGYDQPNLSSKPYSEVYLIDSGNIARQHTAQMNDVYHMVADALFEDFASADFANKKRSIAVNQQQHKILPFSPPVPAGRFGDMKLNYSRTFSSFGQAVLDTQLKFRRDERAHTLAAAMLKAFFGVAGGDAGANRATEKKRDEFMSAHLHMRPAPFGDFPEFSSRDVELKRSAGEFLDYFVVEELLQDRQGALVSGVQQRVTQQLEDIKSGFARDEWPAQIRERVRQLERDVMRDQDSGSDTTEDRIARRRRELLDAIRQAVRQQLFGYLDNKEHGGLEYVLSLVEQIKDRLENPDTGLCKALELNAARYAEIKEAVRTHEYERLMRNLGETRGGMLGGLLGGGERQALLVMEQLSTEIANSLKFHLRAKAAHEAVALMQDVSTWLGVKSGVDAAGQPVWSGLVGEFQAGREAVMDMLAQLDRNVAVLRHDLASEHATLIPVPATERPFATPAASVLREWADEAFKDLGGSRALFPMLADSEERPALLRKVVRMAERQIAINGSANGEESEPLIEALEARSPAERQRMFSELLQRAMPWIDANLARDFTPSSDQFKCFIGVARADEFSRKFKTELEACIPAGTGVTAAQLGIVETGVPGRAVCYTELSGIPLTVLRGLEAWRTSYRKESEKIPAHTHIDSTRFSHPLASSTDELNRLADDFRHYLLAVMLGILERSKQRLVPPGQYQFAVARGDVRRIGNERAIRLNGLPVNYRDQIVERVNLALDDLDGEQCCALAALADYYATAVYTAQLFDDETGAQQVRVGFASAIAAETRRQLGDLALRKGASIAELDRAKGRLIEDDLLREWAEPVPESDADAYEWEVRPPADAKHPRLKYVMRGGHSASIIRDLLNGHPVSAPVMTAPPLQPAGIAPPPLPPTAQDLSYHLSIGGQQYGPYPASQIRDMLQSQRLAPAQTLVWRAGFSAWIALGDCAELSAPQPPAASMPPPPPPPLPI